MPSRRSARSPQRAPRRAKAARVSSTWTVQLASPRETARIGTVLASLVRGGEILALDGELGAGKTYLVRSLAHALGAPVDSIASPTFVLIHEYRGRVPLAHVDLYRLERPDELDQLGWSDYLDGRWVVAAEWAERAGAQMPEDRLVLSLSHRTRTSRMLRCTACGPIAQQLLDGLRRAYRPKAPRPTPAATRRQTRRTRKPSR
ncbi:MAG: tRNA (adenosine(37)-N6)-threonylcarbamoyltransferase complex ATPase subunit type 1 TsaE [Nitrospiraceae bacterium]